VDGAMSDQPPRFHYFRWHSHPLGWGVRDAKHDCVIATGDKNICAIIAAMLNGAPPEFMAGMILRWPQNFDAHVAADAPTWKPETD